jgi:anti-sigma B factor antagonist
MTNAGDFAGPAEPVIVTLPAEIDMAVTPAIAAELTAAVTGGGCLVIADLTGTEFIDSSGARALYRAHRDAAALGTEVRFAISHSAVLRILDLTGLDRELHVYPAVGDALAARAGRAAS